MVTFALVKLVIQFNFVFQRPQSVADISRAESRDDVGGGFSRSTSPNSDIRQSELTRLASIRLHQQLAQSHDKQWTSQHPEVSDGCNI